MNLVREGYLPNWPYHLISDSEMCDAFIKPDGTGFFYDYYPLVDDTLSEQYDELVQSILYHVDEFKADESEEAILPNWIYSYMLKSVVSVESNILDIHDMLVLMNLDNLDDIFTPEASAFCYEISKRWLRKLPPSQRMHRPPTMFGEPHVIKALRLIDVKVDR